MSTTTVLILLFALWVAAHAKTSRPDGKLIPELHPYRTIMGYIMRQRNAAIVYFDVYLDAEPIERYLEEARERFSVDITHALVAACFISLRQNPSMNRFSSGHRLYDRSERQISFSMKRAQLDKKAKLATVKIGAESGESFRGLAERINKSIGVERSGQETYQDKEFNLLTVLPRPILKFGVNFLGALDYCNVLPGAFIKNDPLYTSIFIANLGSLNMGAGFHHLYEWGNCPLFMMVGKIEERASVVNGEVVAQRQLHIRWSYDERIDDGLNARFGIDGVNEVLLNPFESLGCLADDGSDAHALDSV